MEVADLNGLMVKDTVSNGDCLFGAFAISASKFIESWPYTFRNQAIRQSNFLNTRWVNAIVLLRSIRRQPWSLVKKEKNKPRIIRRIACDWAEKHVNNVLWEDFTVGDLARVVSGETFSRCTGVKLFRTLF